MAKTINMLKKMRR